MLKEDQEKIQEAASATIGSLRALLEEKNKLIEKYREKLESNPSQLAKTKAERRADDLLERLAADATIECRI